MAKLQREWPLTDELYGSLYEGIANKEMQTELMPQVTEADDEKESRDEETHSPSGRKYMNFGDLGVNSKSARFICWPFDGKEFKWSSWKDWRKIKPLCRMRFLYSNQHEYGISLSVVGKDYELRGFRSYDLTAQPSLQYLSIQENDDMMKLSLFNKFIRHCISRISKYVSIDPEEVYAKIGKPDKITVDEIAKTQKMIRLTLNNIIKKKQSDSYKWK
jgi:septum formation topological specificity factor MinE